MFTLSLIGYLMIILLLMSMLAKARPKIKEPAPGKALKTLPMGLPSRFQLHRSSLLALLTGILFGVFTGWLSIDSAAIIGVIAIITIFLPMRYTFTTKGIALGEGMFYPWSDFSGYMAKGSSLKFDHPSFFRRLTLFIKPAEMNNVLEYVERYVGTKQKSKI
ncbi:MAG: hypothetical protein IPN96_10770 [Anaerolineales bacterium]|nr:hypothetical protein [Anaerolineales bacterium]